MKVCVISANLGPGGYDREHPWADQLVPDGVEVEIHRLNDSSFSPRPKAMTPALQCGIPKWFGAEFFPYADIYLWLDASVALTRSDNVANWLNEIGKASLCVFRHPERATVQEEYDFITKRMQRPGERYLTDRYATEWLDAEYQWIAARKMPKALPLYATTAFAYRPHWAVLQAFEKTWLAKTKFHLHDQLAFAYEIDNYRRLYESMEVVTMSYNYQKCPELMEFVRGKK